MLARWLLVRGKFQLAPEMLMTIRLREAELQLELSMLARLPSLREKFQLAPELLVTACLPVLQLQVRPPMIFPTRASQAVAFVISRGFF
jgi:hypothetical protein